MKLATRPGLVLALCGLVAACGGGGGTPATPAGSSVTIATSEFAFDPGTITASAGGPLTITLENKGVLEHDFTIDSLSLVVAVAVGETKSGTTAALAAGTYEFYCSIAGHKEAGMVGTLTVQ